MLELIYEKKFNTKKLFIADDTEKSLIDNFLANEKKYTGSLAFFVPASSGVYKKTRITKGIQFFERVA